MSAFTDQGKEICQNNATAQNVERGTLGKQIQSPSCMLITSAFRKCGVYPFSRETISQDLIKPLPVVNPTNENTSAQDMSLDQRSIAAHPMNVDHGLIGGTDSTAESESQSTKVITEVHTSILETGVRIITDLKS